MPTALPADTAQYFYDELGRLAGVIDGQGQVAVYNYDEVGNLLGIQRFTTSGTGIGMFAVAPGSARVNTAVTIQGFGFTSPPSSNQVSFNGVPATVLSATGTSLVTRVPAGASTGPVTVTNANGTATSPSAFTVLVPPIIVSVTPNRVPQGSTVQLVVGGFNLGNTPVVTFTPSNLTATVVQGNNPQEITMNVTVPASAPLQPYTFSVATLGGTATSGAVTVTVTPAQSSSAVAKGSVFRHGPSTGSSSSVVVGSVLLDGPHTGPSFGVAKGSVLLP
ncbi:MAG: IPT/TIG domain-containing protein [Nitrospira defluvii]|nr:IPT/TIG domain-containing protein [Nitrospira defluvii]